MSKCQKIDHPAIAPGWGCCKCRTYNGVQRVQCKACRHVACYTFIEVVDRTGDTTELTSFTAKVYGGKFNA